MVIRYKTASGNHCCNKIAIIDIYRIISVTKPQAVITVATFTSYINTNRSGAWVTKPQAVITVATKSDA